MLGQALAAAEVDARRWRRVVAKDGLLHAACGAFPKPGRIVHNLDFLSGKQLVAGGFGHRVLDVPHLEVNEHLVVGLPALVGLGNHVNSFHGADVQLLHDVKQILARCALEHARDADAGL